MPRSPSMDPGNDASARRHADSELVRVLQKKSLGSREWDEVIRRLAAYAYPVLRHWLIDGSIVGRTARLARHGTKLSVYLGDDDRHEIVIETIFAGVQRFHQAILGNKWDPDRGASLATYFVNSCLLEFSNAYRQWLRQVRGNYVLFDDSDAFAADFLAVDDDPFHDVADREAARNIMERYAIDDTEMRILELLAQGYTTAEIAAEIGRSTRTVQRLVSAIRSRAQDQVPPSSEESWQVVDHAQSRTEEEPDNRSRGGYERLKAFREGQTSKRSWDHLRRWGVSRVDHARVVDAEIDNFSQTLEDPIKKALYRPIEGVDKNRLALLLHDPRRTPDVNVDTERAMKKSLSLFHANGARVLRDLIADLSEKCPPFQRPADVHKGLIEAFQTFYRDLQMVLDKPVPGALVADEDTVMRRGRENFAAFVRQHEKHLLDLDAASRAAEY